MPEEARTNRDAPATYPTLAETLARRLAARRAAAIEAARAAERLAEEAGGRLMVFGSLAEGRFHDRSDIDVAIFGLEPLVEREVALAVDLVLGEAGFEADVIPERFLSPSLRERIESCGREPSALV